MKSRKPIRQVSRNRLFTWMMIGTVFFLIDLAILFYFIRPRDPVQENQQAAVVSTVQQEPDSDVPPTTQTPQPVKK